MNKNKRKLSFSKKLIINFLYLWIKSLRLQNTVELKENFLFATWHEDLLFGIKFLTKNHNITAAASDSKDGDITNYIMTKFGFNVLRGSSNKKPTTILINLIKSAKNNNNIGLTIDGPKGPRHQPKSGIAIISQKTGLPIYCARFVVKGWRMKNTWDNFFIPYPFAKVKVYLSKPIYVTQTTAKQESDKNLEEALEKLTKTLNIELPQQINKKTKQFDFYL